MATEQEVLDDLIQAIANTNISNDDFLQVLKGGRDQDVALRDGTVVPSLSKRVKENTDVVKGEFEVSVNQQTQAQLDLFNTNATDALDSFDGTSTQALTDLQTAIDSINNEGNAASATKLQTPRKINGIDFDGTKDISAPSMPLAVPLFHGGTRTTIETGYVAYDGQLLNRDDYPAMWAKVQATFPIISDADWLANPSNRGSYTSGDDTTTFRMPDYNGVQADSLKGLFLRGDGGGTIGGVAVSSGTTVLSDAIRNITGVIGNVNYSNNQDGAFYSDSNASSSPNVAGSTRVVKMDASRIVPTASENRPVSVVGIWICRVGDTLTEVAEPTLHAVLTGGNTFDGSQEVNGDVTVTGSFTANIKPLLNAEGVAPISACRAWVYFTTLNNVVTIKSSFNVSSVTRISTSLFRITYTVPMPTADNAPLVSGMPVTNTTNQYYCYPDIRAISAEYCEVGNVSPRIDYPLITVGVFC